MAAFTFHSTFFPDGTSVGIYDATLYPNFPTNGPPGTAVKTVTAENYEIEVTGLGNGAAYFAAAKIGSEWRSIRFETPKVEGGGGDVTALEQRVAALETPTLIEDAAEGDLYEFPNPEDVGYYSQLKIDIGADGVVLSPVSLPADKGFAFMFFTVQPNDAVNHFTFDPAVIVAGRGSPPEPTPEKEAEDWFSGVWDGARLRVFPGGYDFMPITEEE